MKKKILVAMLAIIMIMMLIPVMAMTASAADGAPCVSTADCTGTYANGFCTVCDGYEPAVKVTEDNYAELGLTEDYVDYYAISNAGQLFWFAAVVNEGYGDVAKNSSAWGKVTAEIAIPDGHDWVPIGKDVYYGSFDGGSFTISNMQTSGEYSYVGMFGMVEGSELKNITISGSSFATTDTVFGYAGGIVGYANGYNNKVTITGCTVSNTTVTGDEAGGIVGRMDSYPEVTNCQTFSNTITSNSDYGAAGGIAGTMRMGGYITNCIGNGTITGYYAGGVAGYVENQPVPYANRTNSITLCDGYGTIGNDNSQFTGGIVGYVSATTDLTIDNCCVGNSTLTAAYNVNSRVGGLLGGAYGDSDRTVKVTNSYAYNVTISGFSLAYLACGRYVTVENCYSNQAEGANTPLTAGCSISKVERKTNEQFASGEVCWLLNGEKSDGAWGQNLEVLPFPDQGSLKVYKVAIDCQGNMGYFNTESTEPPAHNYVNGFCTNETDGVYCDAYEPATKVTEDNYTELGLTEDYVDYYAISNAGNLYWFADKVDNDNVNFGTANAVLTADVRITSTAYGTRYWNPIGSVDAKYSGIFDGNGKAIDDIFAGITTADLVGLVTWLTEDGVVKNVTLTKNVIKGKDTVGAIVAYNEGTVEQCGNAGSVTGNGISVGGIVGVNVGTVRNCWNTGRITGDDAGGIVGNNKPGAKIENCWSTGTLSGTNTGGIVGVHQTGATVENCYTTQKTAIGTAEGTVSKVETKTADQFASGEVAYLLGSVWGQNIDNDQTVQTVPAPNGATVYKVVIDCKGTVEYSNTNESNTSHDMDKTGKVDSTCTEDGNVEYYTCSVCGKHFSDEDGTTELTDEELVTAALGHKYENGFCTNVNNGTVCDAYEPAVLVTAENYTELGLAESYIGYYAIQNAGQLFWFADKVDNENAAYGAVNVVLTDNITVNTGTMDANTTGARVWNPIGYYKSDSDNAAFNGTFDGNGKTVSGLYFNDASASNVSLIARNGENALVKNVTLTNSYFVGDNNVGGIVAFNYGTVAGCINHATISGDGGNGGIVGYNKGTVELCGNTGTVTNTWCQSGGITGYNNGTVRNCWNTGSIRADTDYAGGIVGYQVKYGNETVLMENCWSTGNASVGDGSRRGYGGIVGYLQGTTTVQNCYTTMSRRLGEHETDAGASTLTNLETKSAAQFASGEVAYLLNGGVTDGTQAFYQTVGEGTPAFSGKTVYYGYISCADDAVETYTNDANASDKKLEHSVIYTASDDVITESCDKCNTVFGTATISATSTTYDRNAKETATVFYSTGWTGGELTVSYTNNVNAGIATASITFGEATASVEFTIAKAALTVTAKAQTKSYGDADPALTYDVSGLMKGDTLSGALTRAAGEDLGSYAITQGTLSAGDNYALSFIGAELTIQAKNISGATVTLEKDTDQYDGTAKKPSVNSVVVDLRELVLNKDYTVAWDKEGFVHAETYTVTITGIGNYTGEITKTYVITPKPLRDSDISIDITEATYNGNAHTPTITVKDGEETLYDYRVEWNNEGFVDAGTYTATITVFGNYSGSFTRTLVINKADLEIELTSPIPSVLPGNYIALTLNTNSGAAPKWEFHNASHVDGTVSTIKINNGLVIGQDTVTITVTYEETNNVKGGSKTITLDVGMADFSGSIAELEADIAELNKLIADKADADEIEQKLTEITNRVKALEDLKEAYIAADASLKSELEEKLSAAKNELTDSINELNDRITEEVKKLQDQITSNDNDITAIQGQIETINGLIKALEKADEALDGKITDAVKKAENELATAVSALEDKIAKEVEKLQNQINANDTDIAAIQGQIETINGLIDALEAADEALDGKITDAVKKAENELATAVSDLEKKIAEEAKKLQNQIDSNDADITAIQEQIETINGLIDALEAADETLGGQLTDAIEKAEKELATAVSDLEDKIAEEVKKLQDQIDANDTDIDGINASITTINGLIDALKKADEALGGDISEAVTKAENELKAVQDELKKLIGDVQTNLDNAKAELDKAIANLDAAMKQGDADLSTEIANLNTALTNAKAALEKADADNKAELVKKIEDADATLDAAIKAVQKNLDDAKAELNKAIADGDTALDEKITNLNAALESAKAALEATDAANKTELEGKITEAQTTLQSAIDKVAKDLADAKTALEKAISDGDSALSDRISALSTALDNAISAYQAADGSLKSELTTKIEAADATLDAAIKAVQKNLDDAKAELNKAIADGDTALEGKITALNEALATAKAALEAADTANKSELTTKIDEACASLDAAIKAVQKNLDDLKAALEAKDNELANKDAELENKDAELENKDSELQTFIIIVCVISGVALCGNGAFVVWFFIDRKKRI